MPAVKTDLTIEQGADWTHGWAVTVNGVAIDATWTARSQVREQSSRPEVLHTFAATVDSAGHVLLSVTPAVSSGWTFTSGVYDVEVVNAAGTVTLRVAQGAVRVSPEVTR